MKEMKKKSILIGGIFAFVCIVSATIFVACQQDADPIPREEAVNVEFRNEDVFFSELTSLWLEETDSIGTNIFSPALASPLYVSKEHPNHNLYVEWISASTPENPFFAVVTIGKRDQTGNCPILKIEKPDSNEVAQIKRERQERLDSLGDSFENISLRASGEKIWVTKISLAKAQEVFNYLKSQNCSNIQKRPCIAWDYLDDGCYARAHYARKLMREKYDIDCRKIFIKGDELCFYNNGFCVKWEYHVAPVVTVQNGGSTTDYVFDPSLFGKPVTRAEWVQAVTYCGICKDGSRANSVIRQTKTVDGKYYSFNGYREFVVEDNDYSLTFAHLKKYSDVYYWEL